MRGLSSFLEHGLGSRPSVSLKKKKLILVACGVYHGIISIRTPICYILYAACMIIQTTAKSSQYSTLSVDKLTGPTLHTAGEVASCPIKGGGQNRFGSGT